MEIFVISIMSEVEITEVKLKKISQIIKSAYNNISLDYNSYKYSDDVYFNTDIDIKGIVFGNSFDEEKIKISKLLVEVLIKLDCFADILAGYQDTNSYVEVYQKNRYKGIISSGIVATNDELERSDLFYKQEGINVYFSNQKERLGKYYNDYIYPMGTVVKLKGDSRTDKLTQYMIIDRFIFKAASPIDYYEYEATVYPIGSLLDNKKILFNNEDIGEVKFIGYETFEDRNLVKDVQNKMEEQGFSKFRI